MSIQINEGDIIGVMGIRDNGSGNGHTSYSQSSPYTSSINGQPVSFYRLGCNNDIINSPANLFWSQVISSLGRVEIEYVHSLPTDAALESFIYLSDTTCSGIRPVSVELKNHGPHHLRNVKINWSVNDTVKPLYEWSGNLYVDSSTTVHLGDHDFITGNSYDIVAFVSDVNNEIDTFPYNDTISLNIINVIQSPDIYVSSDSIDICAGDSAQIIGSLFGSPPWTIYLSDNTTVNAFSNINDTSIGIWVTSQTTTTYMVTQVSDATGCITTDSSEVTVTVIPYPPAQISTPGSGATCQGDSVCLTTPFDPDFSYQWYHNNTILPGDSNYILYTKIPGNYTVEVTNSIGCKTLSQSFTVFIHPLPVIFIGNDTNIAPGESIILDAGTGFTTYNWSTGDVTQTIIVDSSGIGLGTKTIWVEVTDNYSCKGNDTINVTFVHNPGFSKLFKNTKINIYPNPASDHTELLIQGFPQGDIKIELFNIHGELVWQKSSLINLDKERIKIKLDNLACGSYLLKAGNNNGIVTTRVMILR